MNSLTVNALRMRTARRMLGMTRPSLSSATDGRVSVSAIAKLEGGRSIQDDGVVAASLAAALKVPYEFLLGQSERQDYQETPSWRAVKKIPDYVSDGLRERLTYFTDKYRDLEEYVEGQESCRRDLSPAMLELRARHYCKAPLAADDIEQYAKRLRKRVCVSQEQSSACLECITEVMESFGIKIACWPLPPGVSGLSITYGEAGQSGLLRGAVALVNRNQPIERRRFSLAHEWGHLILPQVGDWRDDETACNRFASALLMPKESLQTDVKRILGGPINHQAQAFDDAILNLKIKYGVSAAALLRRCSDIGLIQPPQLYSTIARLLGIHGWFREEPEPRWTGEEKPKRFADLLNKLDDEDRQRSIDKEFLRDVRFLDTA